MKESLIRRIEMQVVDKKVLEVFSAEQFKALYDACAKEPYEPLIYRDRAILALLLDTGIRLRELCGLTVDQVFFDEEESFIRVFGKGRKQREVGFGTKPRRVLKSYIHRWRKATKAADGSRIMHAHGAATVHYARYPL